VLVGVHQFCRPSADCPPPFSRHSAPLRPSHGNVVFDGGNKLFDGVRCCRASRTEPQKIADSPDTSWGHVAIYRYLLILRYWRKLCVVLMRLDCRWKWLLRRRPSSNPTHWAVDCFFFILVIWQSIFKTTPFLYIDIGICVAYAVVKYGRRRIGSSRTALSRGAFITH